MNTATIETFPQAGLSLGRAVRLLVPVLCALAGFLSAFTLKFVGLLPAGELVLLGVFPLAVFLRFYRREWPAEIQRNRWFFVLLAALFLTACGYVVSDLYRSTPSNNLLRGWARIAFLGIDLVAISTLVGGSWKNFWIFVAAAALGQVAEACIFGPELDDYWKFCFAFPVTALGLLIVAERGRWLQIFTAAALGMIHLALGYRSLGGICLIIAAILYVREARSRWRWPLATVGAALVFGTIVTIQNMAEQDDAHRNSNLERRSMIEASLDLFLDSPIIGQGSWFTTRKIAKVEEHRAKIDETFGQYTQEEIEALSIHSQILVALAEGGVVGGTFFFVYGPLILVALRVAWRDPVPRRAFALLILLDAAWNYLMSPFSGVSRVWIALCISLCLLLWQQHRYGLNEE